MWSTEPVCIPKVAVWLDVDAVWESCGECFTTYVRCVFRVPMPLQWEGLAARLGTLPILAEVDPSRPMSDEIRLYRPVTADLLLHS